MRRIVGILTIFYAVASSPVGALETPLTLKQQAKAGDAEAQYQLAQAYEHPPIPNPTMARYWYEKASKQDHAIASKRMGDIYYEGHWVKQDYHLAGHYYRLAINEGDANAAVALANMYYVGKGVPLNIPRAVACFKMASEQGHASAQYQLASLYTKGKGVKKDLHQAFYWYEAAAKQGLTEAQLRLGYLYSQGYGIDKDLDQAIVWYRKAAQAGHAQAQYKLGWLLSKNPSTEDQTEALAWFILAREKGSKLSRLYERKLKKNLTPAEQAASEALVVTLQAQGR